MNLNLLNVPKAIIYFLLGVLLNVVFYYIFSPDQVDSLSILGSLFTMSSSTVGIIYVGIMSVSILATILYPAWCLLEE